MVEKRRKAGLNSFAGFVSHRLIVIRCEAQRAGSAVRMASISEAEMPSTIVRLTMG